MIDLVDYEGYAITGMGQVWSYPKALTGVLKGKGQTKGKWLKQSNSTNGYKSINLGAKNRNIEFKRSIKEMWDLFVQQNKLCAITGVKLIMPNKNNKNNKNIASLDRIDSTKGYIKDNLQWVHKDINQMKWNYEQNYFIKLCRMVINYNAE